MNDRLYLNSLFDIYQELLTEHEQLIFKDYYQDDLSLKEIADNNNISRSAVHNTLKAVNEKLSQVVPRQQKIREELEAIIKELEVDYHE